MNKNIVILIAVVFSLFTVGAARASDGKVNVCHVPPGNPRDAHVISIDPDSAGDHLAHGDNLGACCPCWVRGNRPGGIDFQAQELEAGLKTCGIGPNGALLLGVREGTLVWFAAALVTECFLEDDLNGILINVLDPTAEESAACLDILLESQMWTLNCDAAN